MAEKNPKTTDGLVEKINAIISKTMKYATRPQGARPFFPPPGLTLSHLKKPADSSTSPHPAYPESGSNIAEPLETASSATSNTSSMIAEASGTSTSPCSEPFETVRPYKMDCISLLSPESPPPERPPRSHQIAPPASPESPSRPRYLGKSHRVEPPLSTRKIANLENLSVSCCSTDELQLYVALEMLLQNADAQNQLNESVDLLRCMEFPEKLPDSPPSYTSDQENTEPLVLEEIKPEKEKECIICKRFERMSLQKDEVHLSWTLCKFYLTSHMHDICAWGLVKPKPKFWLNFEYQRSRQNFDVEAKKYLDELDLRSLSTTVTLYLEQFMQVLYHHTPLEQVYSEEKCEKLLKELLTEFLNLLTAREDALCYLLYEEEGFRHNQCESYKMAIEWIKECTREISEGLREFEINLENLHLGRLIWSNDESTEEIFF